MSFHRFSMDETKAILPRNEMSPGKDAALLHRSPERHPSSIAVALETGVPLYHARLYPPWRATLSQPNLKPLAKRTLPSWRVVRVNAARPKSRQSFVFPTAPNASAMEAFSRHRATRPTSISDQRTRASSQ